MKKLNLILLLAILGGFSLNLFAQEDEVVTKTEVTDVVKATAKTTDDLRKVQLDSAKNWKINGAIGTNSSVTMLTNWAAGGSNSASLIGYGNIRIIYQKNKLAWETFFDTEFGYTYLDKSQYSWRKSNDKLNFSSKLGYSVGKNLFVTAMGAFRTQYAEGYDYPNDSTKNYISNFLSPSYTDLSVGMDWKPNSIFSIYLSPAAGRITTATDSTLRAKYGVDPAKSFKAEFGAMLKGEVNYQYKDFKVLSALTLFTPYSKKFGNVDIDWDLSISYQLMKVLSVSLGTTMKYYDAIKFDTGDGKGVTQHVQFKTMIGLGIGYTF